MFNSNTDKELDTYLQHGWYWNTLSEVHRQERMQLEKILPRFDLHATEHDAPAR